MKNGHFNKNYSRKAAALLSVLVTIHFAFTLVYVTPNHYFPQGVNEVVSSYMLPAFHQGWNLFAPDPPIKEKSMIFRVKTGAGWSGWLNPGQELLAAHDRCRLSNANIMFRLHQNAAYRLWEEYYRTPEATGENDAEIDEELLFASRGYRTAKYYAVQWFENQFEEEQPDSIQLRLLIDAPPLFPGDTDGWERKVINFPIDVAQ